MLALVARQFANARFVVGRGDDFYSTLSIIALDRPPRFAFFFLEMHRGRHAFRSVGQGYRPKRAHRESKAVSRLLPIKTFVGGGDRRAVVP